MPTMWWKYHHGLTTPVKRKSTQLKTKEVIMCCLVRATVENVTKMEWWLAGWKPQKFTENCSSEPHRK